MSATERAALVVAFDEIHASRQRLDVFMHESAIPELKQVVVDIQQKYKPVRQVVLAKGKSHINKDGHLILVYTDGYEEDVGDVRVTPIIRHTPPVMGGGGSGLSRQEVLQLIEDNTVSESSEIEHTHAAIHVTASGDTTVLTPTDPAKCISIVRISAMSDMDDADSPLIKIGFGTSGGAIVTEKFRGAVVSARQLCVGGAGQSVIVNLESAAKVDGTIIYDEVAP